MPHKRNPVLSENLTGLARMVRAAVVPALENVTLWHERDISHSSVERVIAPDATVDAGFRAGAAGRHDASGWWSIPERMAANLESLGGVVHSGEVLLALTRAGHLARGRLSRSCSATRWRRGQKLGTPEGRSFRDNLQADPEVTRPRLGGGTGRGDGSEHAPQRGGSDFRAGVPRRWGAQVINRTTPMAAAMIRGVAAACLGLMVLTGAAQAGTLRIGTQEDPDRLDPALGGTLGRPLHLHRAVRQAGRPVADLNFVPQLATAWNWSPDSRALTLTLRDGVTYQDGEPMTAELVRANWNATARCPTACARAS